MSNFEDVEFQDNPDPRCPCLLLLDTSGSMSGDRIAALNEGLQAFQADISRDPLSRRRVEVAIITFGNGGVQTRQEFVTVDNFQAPILTVGGNTPMGEAIKQGLNLLRTRKEQYKNNSIDYYRPWIFLITDGEPTDEWQSAAQLVHEEEGRKGVAFFAVGVKGANMQTLAQITVAQRPPKILQGLNFVGLFLWLSQSQQRVSNSKIGDQTALPAADGWAVI